MSLLQQLRCHSEDLLLSDISHCVRTLVVVVVVVVDLVVVLLCDSRK